MTTPKLCITCDVPLVLETNWYPSFKAKRHYKCKACYDHRRLLNKIKRDGPSDNLVARLLQRQADISFNRISEGYVYVITNPAWDNWYKVGSSLNANNRCRSYQTSSPHRDYELLHAKRFDNRLDKEREIHSILEQQGYTREGEWFNSNSAQSIIEVIECHN
jgi:hypothetical protein